MSAKEKTKGFFAEFRKFIARGNVMDLAVAVALISSLKDKPVREDTVVFGEIGLTGELRSVSHSDLRIAEAARLGFTRCVVPYHGLKNLSASKCEGVEVIGARNIRDAFEAST